MIRKFAKKSKLIVAGSALLFATAFQAGTCSLNIDQALLDQLSGLLGNFSFEGRFNGGGPGDGHRDGPNHDGQDDGPDTSNDNGFVDATSTGV